MVGNHELSRILKPILMPPERTTNHRELESREPRTDREASSSITKRRFLAQLLSELKIRKAHFQALQHVFPPTISTHSEPRSEA